MTDSNPYLSLIIPLIILLVTLVVAHLSYDRISEINKQKTLENGTSLGKIKSISTGSEYCVLTTYNGSEYVLNPVDRCENLESGMLLYRAPKSVGKMPFGNKLYTFTAEEVKN